MKNEKLETISNLFEGKEIRSVWDAEKEEYYLLRERLEFMDKQMLGKEQRFDEQTAVLREVQKQLNEEIKNNGLLSAEIAALKAERAMKLCQVRNCPKREPQSGY